MVFNTFKEVFGKSINFIFRQVDGPLEKIFWNIFLIIFMTFVNWGVYQLEGNGDEKLNFSDALYYTITTHFTIGFGDITPIGPWSRLVYYFHVFTVWFINMIPSGLKLYEEFDKTNKVPFAGQRKLERQSNFKSVLPRGSRTDLAGQKYTV